MAMRTVPAHHAVGCNVKNLSIQEKGLVLSVMLLLGQVNRVKLSVQVRKLVALGENTNREGQS